MRRYRIISDSENQLCNRFFSYLDSISWAIRNNAHVYVLFWNENIKYFDVLRDNVYVSFPFYFVEKHPLLKSIYCRTIDSELANKFYCSKIGRKMGFISGWPRRGLTDNLLCDKTELRKIFIPNQNVRSNVDTLFVDKKKMGKVVIGVHIRRGDYSTFCGGKYYFDVPVYEQKMEEVKKLFRAENVVFYLASNERLSTELQKRTDVIWMNQANTATDLYALSLCDFLIGPPSTFTRWVSYLNDIPLYFIFDKNEKIDSMDSFSPIKDHYHFKDGRKLPF